LSCRFAASTGELSALTVTKKAPPSFSFGTAPRARLFMLLLQLPIVVLCRCSFV